MINQLTRQELLLIQLLADGEIHSGQALCQATGTTRSHIWKLLHKIQTVGIPMTSQKGRGYCIPGGLDLLNHTQILQYVHAHALLSRQPYSPRIEIFSLIESTNRYLLQKIKQKSEKPDTSRSDSVCLAEGQTQGYGRRGQTWMSPFAQNIYFSLYRCMDNNLVNLTGLPLMAGVVMRQVLLQLGYSSIQLKWPNDIYAGDKKLGGVLVELVSDAVGPCHVVIGIGLNVHMLQVQTVGVAAEHDILQPWTSLALLQQPTTEAPRPSRNYIISHMLHYLNAALNVFEQHGFQPFLNQWREADYLSGQHIMLTTQAGVVRGNYIGISDDGALQVMVDGMLQSYRGAVMQIRIIDSLI